MEHWIILAFLKLEVVSGERTKIPATSSVCPNQTCLVSVLQLYILFYFLRPKLENWKEKKKQKLKGLNISRKKKKRVFNGLRMVCSNFLGLIQNAAWSMEHTARSRQGRRTLTWVRAEGCVGHGPPSPGTLHLHCSLLTKAVIKQLKQWRLSKLGQETLPVIPQISCCI